MINKSKLYLAVPAVSVAAVALTPFASYAADPDAATAASSAVALVTSISTLFTAYPMNIFLGCGLAAAGLGLFARAKRTSKG